MPKAVHTKPQIISAIKALARRLKRTPTRSEFQSMSGIHWTKVQRLFGGYRAAVREAGLEPDPGGIRIGSVAMLLDFGRVARKVKRHPTRDEYEKLGRYASASLENRFRRWSAVRERFLEYVAGSGLDQEWKDVAESLRNGPVPRRGGGKSWLKGLPRIEADERGSKPFLPRINANEQRLNEKGNSPAFMTVGRHDGKNEMENAGDGRLPQGLKPEFQQEGDRRPEGLLHPGAAANITADQSCNQPLEPRAEPIRAELLYPQLRGMHCVTKTVLWVMSGYQNAAREEAHGRSTANGGDGLVWAQSRAGEITCTDRSVCATQFWAASAELALHFPKRVFPGRPLMGPPFLPQPRNAGASGELALMLHGMAYEPVNEMGVVFLFGMVAPLLGFRVEALQTGFPDCKAKLEVEPGRWQDVNVEFEFESRKFRDHHHDPLKCDIIVCWRHNWKGCPERIQVVELSRILGVSR